MQTGRSISANRLFTVTFLTWGSIAALPSGALGDVVTFPEARDVSQVMSITQSAAVGDLDGDLDLDVVLGPNFGTPRYALNNGTDDPFSGPDVDLPLDPDRSGNDVTVGDLNGDGRLDIIVASFNGVDHYYPNNGTVTPFDGVAPVDIGTDTDSTSSIHAVDIDGDLDVDVLTANTNQQTNKIYFNNGTADPFDGVSGVDLSYDLFYSQEMAFGDVDGDGDTDIVVVNEDSIATHINIQLFLNNGTSDPFDGVIGLDVFTGEGVRSVDLGDVDGDGDLDLAASTSGSTETALLVFNNGSEDPYFNTTIQAVPDGIAGFSDFVQLVDMNADTLPDLVITAFLENQQHLVYLNNGTADPFADRLGIQIAPTGIGSWEYAVGDIDGDGDNDIVIPAISLADPDRVYLAAIGPDMAPPVVEITQPPADATLVGDVTVEASAVDNIGVASVTVEVGDLLIAQILSPPFEASFDTTLVPNGLTSISAIAEDPSGNQATASVVVTIDNPIRNEPPVVDAGEDMTIVLPTDSVVLNGSVSDDGLPDDVLSVSWSQVRGPADATFADGNALSTLATFPAAGTYVLTLTASDGELESSSEMTVTVEAAAAPPSGNGGGGGAPGPGELLALLVLFSLRRAMTKAVR